MTLTKTCKLYGRDDAGTLIETGVAATFLSRPRREIGLAGNNISLRVAASDWPASGPGDWDLSRGMRLVFGHLGTGTDVDQLITLDQLYIQQVTPSDIGVTFGTASAPEGGGTSTHQFVELLLTTVIGARQDGRGGLLTLGILNPLGADGRVDTMHASYLTNVELVTAAIAAMGLNDGYIPPELDDFEPVGPLDWGNASAQAELEGLCDLWGAVPILSLGGTGIDVQILPRAGEAINLGAYDEIAEPYVLAKSPAVRGRTIVVLSGRTRTVEITTLGLADFEWVWRDPASGAWLSNDETTSGRKPGLIADYNSATGKTPEDRREFNRMFRALRLTDTARADGDIGRLVPLDVPHAASGDVPEQGGGAYVLCAECCVPASAGQLVRAANLGLWGARVHPEGVIELPSGAAYVKSPGASDDPQTTASVVALESGDLSITLAYEPATGDVTDDYYAAGWSAAIVDGAVVLTRLDATQLAAAIADPESLKIQAPSIRRLVDFRGASPVELNDDDNDAIAESLARARAAGDLLESGVVELVGLVNVLPGFSPAATSSVEWDLERNRTILQLNEHDAPQSFYETLAAQASRSFAAGLSRFSVPGAAADKLLPAAGPGPGGGAGGGGGGAVSGERGAERSAGVPAVAQTATATSGVAVVSGQEMGRILARITGSSGGPPSWTYSWEEVRRSGSSWSASGRTSTQFGAAINGCEAPNAGSTYGNGVSAANLCEGVTLQPVATGTIHVMEVIGGVVFFSSPNGVDGSAA